MSGIAPSELGEVMIKNGLEKFIAIDHSRELAYGIIRLEWHDRARA